MRIRNTVVEAHAKAWWALDSYRPWERATTLERTKYMVRSRRILQETQPVWTEEIVRAFQTSTWDQVENPPIKDPRAEASSWMSGVQDGIDFCCSLLRKGVKSD